jgi:hypothetical protein
MVNSNDDVDVNKLIGAKVIARAWSDPAFKARLISHPTDVLREAGAIIPDGVDFKVTEDASDDSAGNVLVLPPKPSDEEIGTSDVSVMAASRCSGTWFNLCGSA